MGKSIENLCKRTQENNHVWIYLWAQTYKNIKIKKKVVTISNCSDQIIIPITIPSQAKKTHDQGFYNHQKGSWGSLTRISKKLVANIIDPTISKNSSQGSSIPRFPKTSCGDHWSHDPKANIWNRDYYLRMSDMTHNSVPSWQLAWIWQLCDLR